MTGWPQSRISAGTCDGAARAISGAQISPNACPVTRCVADDTRIAAKQAMYAKGVASINSVSVVVMPVSETDNAWRPPATSCKGSEFYNLRVSRLSYFVNNENVSGRAPACQAKPHA